MHHEIRFVFNDDNNATVVIDGNSVIMSNDLAIFLYNSIIDTVVESAVKTIEKHPLTEFVHLMHDGKIIIRLKRKEDGDIVEATIVFDELSEEDRKILEQGEE